MYRIWWARSHLIFENYYQTLTFSVLDAAIMFKLHLVFKSLLSNLINVTFRFINTIHLINVLVSIKAIIWCLLYRWPVYMVRVIELNISSVCEANKKLHRCAMMLSRRNNYKRHTTQSSLILKYLHANCMHSVNETVFIS